MAQNEVVTVVSPGSLRGGYVKRQVLSELFSILVVTGIIWFLLSVMLRERLAAGVPAPALLIEALTVSFFGALSCPTAALVSDRRWGTGNLARSVTIAGAFAAVWVSFWYVSHSVMNLRIDKPAWLYFGILLAPLVLYIAIRRGVAALSDRVFNRNILIIGDEEGIRATYGQLARGVGTQRRIRTKVLMRHTGEILPDKIARLVAEEECNEIVVAGRDRRESGIAMSTLLELKMGGIQISDFTNFIEHEKGRVELDGLRPGWIVYSDGFRKSRVFRLVKRIVDVFVSAFVLVLSLPPVMLSVAVAVKLCDPGPVIHRQRRVGFAGKIFTLYKFRSMSIDAETTGHPVWARKADPRVTPVGRFIRATHVDELPQLINVLKGEMSLVGPRPERPEFVTMLRDQIEYYDLRHHVLPGLTGWSQINIGYTDDTNGAIRKVSYDLYYMKHASIFFDLYICARTVKTILWCEGAR